MWYKVWNFAKKSAKVAVWVWTMWASIVWEKIYDKYFSEEWKSQREINQIESLETRFKTKIENIQNEKSKIEDLFEKKMWTRNEILWNLWWILEWVWISDNDKDLFLVLQ